MAPDKDKCTFGGRVSVDIHKLNAMIKREVKHFRNYKVYRPNFQVFPVSGKFYAAHDRSMDTEEETQKVAAYCSKVEQTRSKGPHNRYPIPLTTNHEYGWYQTPILAMDRNDPRFYRPKKESTYTKIEIIILMSNPQKQISPEAEEKKLKKPSK